MITDSRRAEFAQLFEEFAGSYPTTPDGQAHITVYEESRRQGRENFEAVTAAHDRGDDVTDDVLRKLLPHYDTAPNRERGAWVHVGPAIRKDVKEWFDRTGWIDREDWPRIAREILRFLRRCADDPSDLEAACAEFAGLSYIRGFQAAMLTPILNALRPDDFLLDNAKARPVVNYFGETSYRAGLADYPAANATGRGLIDALASEMDHPSVAALSPGDRLDMFSHWLVAIKNYAFATARYWKTAPGEGAWNWETCRENGFIAIGWSELGDISGLSRAAFDEKRDELVARHAEWTKTGVNQVWTFAHIREGDRIVANHGTAKVLGIGTVTGPYYFVEGERHAHQLPVQWDDLTPRSVNEPGWKRTIVKLDADRFRAICNTVNPDCPFSLTTFELLAGLHADPAVDFYSGRRDEFNAHLEEPFKALLGAVAERLPQPISDLMQTERGVLARIPKNDFGRGGAWDFYWGAFYPKGGKRIEDAQLLVWINDERLEFGFCIGDYASEQRQRFLRNCRDLADVLPTILEPLLDPGSLVYGSRHRHGDLLEANSAAAMASSWREWLANPREAGIRAVLRLPKDDVLEHSNEQLAGLIVAYFRIVFPFVLLAVADDPLPAIRTYLDQDGSEVNPIYSLEQCAEQTGFDVAQLQRWVRAIERKKQAVLYGPPGTGKTYLAERLARHLIGDGDGFMDIVQFHPAYAYEDFVQGIRPRARSDGGLDYPLVPGRFLDFCTRARACEATCVLIIDEINRANLARVFGEVMYLLEYRDEDVPLASGGRFHIPANVRIIGTMNTADRSIALVDHALRRRFAFLALYPNYEILRHFHQRTGFPVEPLIQTLQSLNQTIADRHYEIGVSFFLHEDVATQLEDIWTMEIEPYLEEYFFDRPDEVHPFRWDNIKERLAP